MKKYGKGVGCMWYGIGNTGLPNPAAAFLEVLGDCSVNLSIGAADIGQGSTTVMAQIAAEELGLPYESINVTFADTMVTPEGGGHISQPADFYHRERRSECRPAGQGCPIGCGC